MNDEPSDDLIRELYAKFGLAYYQSECLHRELCFVLAWSGLPSPDMTTRLRVDELLANAYSLTLGDVAAKLDGVLPVELFDELREAVDSRNFLAHQFWFERAYLVFSARNVHQMIAELDGYAKQFRRLDTLISEWKKPALLELGLTDEVIERSLRNTLAGEQDEMLPDRKTVRTLERRLRGRQQLIRVWEILTEHGLRSLIFELADGTLWQLSDVGLGWTKFQKVEPGWTELLATRPYLPAQIQMRPRHVAHWDYEFALANGAALWVKPGQQKRTFKWGLRTPKEKNIG